MNYLPKRFSLRHVSKITVPVVNNQIPKYLTKHRLIFSWQTGCLWCEAVESQLNVDLKTNFVLRKVHGILVWPGYTTVECNIWISHEMSMTPSPVSCKIVVALVFIWPRPIFIIVVAFKHFDEYQQELITPRNSHVALGWLPTHNRWKWLWISHPVADHKVGLVPEALKGQGLCDQSPWHLIILCPASCMPHQLIQWLWLTTDQWQK